MLAVVSLVALGGFLVARQIADDDLESQILKQASAYASIAARVSEPSLLARLRQLARVQDSVVLPLDPSGEPKGRLPDHLRIGKLSSEALGLDEAIVGHQSGLVYAAVPFRLSPLAVRRIDASRRGQRANASQVVILASRVDLLGGATGLLVLVAGAVTVATIAAAALAAVRVSRRITGPLHQVEVMTSRIAAGDLSSRIAEQKGLYPELASLSRSINQMAAKLARSRQMDKQFLMSVSHDLRTPLTAIQGYAEALADQAVEPTRAAQVIKAESDRLARLVADLLELAKLDSRRFSLNMTKVDILALAERVVEGFRPRLEDLGVEIALVPAPDNAHWRPVATADPGRLEQMLANLLDNASRFAHRRITVGVARDSSAPEAAVATILSVSDDGPGVAPDEQRLIFNRLYQSQRTPPRSQGSGAGLGLAIAAELAKAMGTELRVVSPAEDGLGARFEIILKSLIRSE